MSNLTPEEFEWVLASLDYYFNNVALSRLDMSEIEEIEALLHKLRDSE